MLKDEYLLREIQLSNDLGTIIAPTVKEVLKIKEENLMNLLYPFFIEPKENNEDIKLFDVFFFKDENGKLTDLLILLVNVLKFIYKNDQVEFDTDIYGNINIKISDAKINRDNFDILSETIRDLFFVPKPKEKENEIIQVSEENKAILEEYLRLKQQHELEMEELNKKNHKTLHQIITIVASQCFWDYDKVLNMTYYRLINSYMSIFKIDNYETYRRYVTSGNCDMKNHQQKHWTDEVGK